jgi:glycosyltransferase involved in cell wall biosynthesis
MNENDASMAGCRIAVMLKTNSGGLWIIPQVEELRRRGHHVVAILPPGPGRLTAELTKRGIEVFESPFNFRFRPTIATLRGLWQLRRLIRRLQLDVLHYHLYSSALAARLSTAGLPLRRVHMVAGPLYLESSIIRSVERPLWRLDDVTICSTQHISELYGDLGCPADRRPVVQYGIDVDYFTPPWAAAGAAAGTDTWSRARAKARREIGMPEDGFLVLMVAYVYPPKRLVYKGRGIKGHDVLLTAWPSFHARHPDSHLVLIGAGWAEAGEEYRRRLISRFGVEEDSSVTWLGGVPDLRPFQIAADVNVVPSLSEGENGVAREAAAMGLPSIVSDVGGLPDAIDDTCGWVIARDDPQALTAALEEAYEEFEAGRLPIRGDLARERAIKCFDRRDAAEKVADIVERAAGRVPQP